MSQKITPLYAAERDVCGIALRGPHYLDEARLVVSPEDFSNDPFFQIFNAACQLRDAGQVVDQRSVQIKILKDGRGASLGVNSDEFVQEVFDSVISTDNLKFTASVVREASDRRILIRIADFIKSSASSGEPPSAVANQAAEKILKIGQGDKRKGPVHISEIAKRSLERYDAYSRGEKPLGFPSGIGALDQMTGGFLPGQLTIIGARPSVGKSALATQLSVSVAKAGYPNVVFSHEMLEDEVFDRMMAAEARVTLPRLRGVHKLDEQDVERIILQCEPGRLGGLPIFIDEQQGVTANVISSITRNWVYRHGVRMIFIDYLQLVESEESDSQRYLQVGNSCKALKRVAKECKVAVVCLSQLSRKVEERPDKTPMISDLKESGDIEAHADVVMLLHRLDNDDKSPTHRVNILVEKNRHGPCGVVSTAYQRRFTKFEEVIP